MTPSQKLKIHLQKTSLPEVVQGTERADKPVLLIKLTQASRDKVSALPAAPESFDSNMKQFLISSLFHLKGLPDGPEKEAAISDVAERAPFLCKSAATFSERIEKAGNVDGFVFSSQNRSALEGARASIDPAALDELKVFYERIEASIKKIVDSIQSEGMSYLMGENLEGVSGGMTADVHQVLQLMGFSRDLYLKINHHDLVDIGVKEEMEKLQAKDPNNTHLEETVYPPMEVDSIGKLFKLLQDNGDAEQVRTELIRFIKIVLTHMKSGLAGQLDLSFLPRFDQPDKRNMNFVKTPFGQLEFCLDVINRFVHVLEMIAYQKIYLLMDDKETIEPENIGSANS